MSDWFLEHGAAEVHPALIVGAMPLDANDVQRVADWRVDRVLNLVENDEYPAGARLEVEIALEVNAIAERRVQVVDFGTLSAQALEHAVDQVDTWLEEGHAVYLHCRAGWQRSAAVAAGVIAIREQVTLDAALERLRERKPTADPLPHQKNDLRLWWEARASS